MSFVKGARSAERTGAVHRADPISRVGPGFTKRGDRFAEILACRCFRCAFRVALTLAGTVSGPVAQAVPIPGVAPETVLHARLALLGADRPDAAILGAQVGGTLRADPSAAGRLTARRQLTDAGVPAGFQEGWVLGTSVDVLCPELAPVLRA